MTKSRKCLTAFWDCIRATWHTRQVAVQKSEMFITEMLSQMSFDVAPRSLEEVEEERMRIQRKDQQAKAHRQKQRDGAPFVQQEWDLGRKNDDDTVRRNVTKKTNARHVLT